MRIQSQYQYQSMVLVLHEDIVYKELSSLLNAQLEHLILLQAKISYLIVKHVLQVHIVVYQVYQPFKALVQLDIIVLQDLKKLNLLVFIVSLGNIALPDLRLQPHALLERIKINLDNHLALLALLDSSVL